jgi:hypothetical protein
MAMVSESIAVIAVTGALVGAALNAIRAWYQAPDGEKFSWKKFGAGLVSGGLSALGVLSFVTLPEQAAHGNVALFVGNMLLGAGASTALAKAHE